MKKKLPILLFIILAALLLAGNASALPSNSSIDGILAGDWDINTAAGFNPFEGTGNEKTGRTADGIWWWEEDSGDAWKVGPGYGGPWLDVQGLYAYTDTDAFYFAVISGFHTSSATEYYQPGDIIIYAGNTYAVETTGWQYLLSSGGYRTGELECGVQGHLYEVPGDASLLDGIGAWSGPDNQNPTQIAANPGSGVLIDFIINETTFANHTVMEGRVPLSDLDNFAGPISFHFASACGNDGGTTPVPEPATMLLLGVGLIGLAGVGRKRFLKKP